ncbi:hypothetical protein C0V77_13370 [Emticicia sp. TH156]|nr:hypothetical protein C0V77_13370 [Emticicia sp. TH156]
MFSPGGQQAQQQFSAHLTNFKAATQFYYTPGTNKDSLLFLNEIELEKEESTGNEQPVLYIADNISFLKAKWLSLLTDNRPTCQRQQPERWSVRLFIVYCVYTI